MTSDALHELQHRTIEAQTASMKEAGEAIVNAKIRILSQRSTIEHYERALIRAVSNLEAAKAAPQRAAQLLDDTIRLIQSALDGECE